MRASFTQASSRDAKRSFLLDMHISTSLRLDQENATSTSQHNAYMHHSVNVLRALSPLRYHLPPQITLALVRSSWLRRVTSNTGLSATHRQTQCTIDYRIVLITLPASHVDSPKDIDWKLPKSECATEPKAGARSPSTSVSFDKATELELERLSRVYGQYANVTHSVIAHGKSFPLVDWLEITNT